uniref:Mediator of RNA polymerase II transcription subunit 11 n=1 Tax=Parastrongyloides trichosuri TaxID=131310 RepID=A0A0N4ZEI7_PARTI
MNLPNQQFNQQTFNPSTPMSQSEIQQQGSIKQQPTPQQQQQTTMPKINSLIHQAPPQQPIEAEYTLSTRLANIDVVEQKISELIKYTRICLQELSKDKQITKNKMEDASQNFRKCLNAIDSDLSEQLEYLSRVCVGVDHQGSTFSTEANIRIAKESEDIIGRELMNVYNEYFGDSESH